MRGVKNHLPKKCPKCGISQNYYPFKCTYKIHLDRCDGIKPKPRRDPNSFPDTCPKCGIEKSHYKGIHAYIGHIDRCTGTKPIKYVSYKVLSGPCPKCGIKPDHYKSEIIHRRHVKTCTGKRPKILNSRLNPPDVCPKCGIACALYSPLDNHQSFWGHIKGCTGSKPGVFVGPRVQWRDAHTCPKCDVSEKKYADNGSFISHLVICRGIKTPKTCFKTYFNSKIKYPAACPKCGSNSERYSSQASYRLHVRKCVGRISSDRMFAEMGNVEVDKCPKCGVERNKYSSLGGFRAHMRGCKGIPPKDHAFGRYGIIYPSKCPKCKVNESAYVSRSTWRLHLSICKGKRTSKRRFLKHRLLTKPPCEGSVHKNDQSGTWDATITVTGIVCMAKFKTKSEARHSLLRMSQRAKEVVGGLFSGTDDETKRYVLQSEDPYKKKDEMRRTWTELALQIMWHSGLEVERPRAIMLPGLRPEARSECFTRPYMGHTCRVVMTERGQRRASLSPDHDIIVGDLFAVLYEKAFKENGPEVTQFSFVDFDICEQPTKEIVGPFKEMVKNREGVLTSPCAIRIVTSKRPRKCGRERSLLSRYIHDHSKVLNYIEMPYSSTGTPMHMQQWVIK